ncbi:MAG: putative lipid II flippase FtsW [Halofilum sp. (in: g-proteobacteria)]
MSASTAMTRLAITPPRWLVRPRDVDPVMAICALILLALGAVMVASASITVAARELGDPWHYLFRQLTFIGLGLGLAAVIVQIPLARWQQLALPLLLAGLALLALVLVPGFGRTVNGSTRWLELGVIGFQVSEAAKLAVLLYLADYSVRRRDQLVASWGGFLRPLVLVGIGAVLLLMEPDFGAAVVLVATAMAVLFLGGVPLSRFLLLALVATAGVIALALSSPYRVERISAFLDPWADPFDSGFQLTQSLIAVGSGGWTGVGLGGSVQKLFYLPEGHTDFLFAIFAEEMGLIGVLAVIALFVVLIGRAFGISARADRAGLGFGALLSVGIGVWLALQAFINAGVNMGLLPTKGLTLPLMSYGGSSTLVMCAAIGLLLRVERETALTTRHAQRRRSES